MRKFVFGGSFTSFVFDPDALAYFAVNSAITLDADKLEIDAFYKGLKADGIYTKIKAMYFPKWASASNNKWNLKDPRDLDAAYRLVFSGGWTYSSGGATPNGTNAFADTYLNNNVMSQNSIHISAWSRTNQDSVTTLLSSWNSGFGTSIYPRSGGDTYCHNNSTTAGVQSSPEGTIAFYLNSRVNSTQILIQRNSTQNTKNVTSNSHISTSFKIGKTGEANAEYASRQLCFITIGDGLNATESLALYNRFNTLYIYFGLA
jgi:hypothetical protein